MNSRLHHSSGGFTLVELLVVIGIIALLAGLIVGSAYPTMRFNAMKSDTVRRINNLNVAVDMRQSGDADRMEALVRLASGHDLRLRSLRQVIGAVSLYASGSTEYFDPNVPVNKLPPYIRTRNWVQSKGLSDKMSLTSAWRLPGHGMDFHIAFLDRQVPLLPSARVVDEEAFNIWGPVTESKGYTRPIFRPEDMEGKWPGGYDRTTESRIFIPRTYTESPIGESLDGTLEVMPAADWTSDDAVHANCSFRLAWPNLLEEVVDEPGEPLTFNQVTWTWGPNWRDASTPHEATPMWGSPWGEGVISRNPNRWRGNQVAYKEPRTFRESLNPLVAPELLVYAGLFDAHGRDPSVWRDDRNPRQQWNDAWGNPLFVSAAVYHAPRYDFIDEGIYAAKYVEKEALAGRRLGSREILGGRDYLFRRAQEVYGYGRAVYVASGAIGPGEDAGLQQTWDQSDDIMIIRAAWEYITDRTLPSDRDDDGWNWNETSFESAPTPSGDDPWQGVRVYPDFSRNSDKNAWDTDRRNPVFLSAPVIIR